MEERERRREEGGTAGRSEGGWEGRWDDWEGGKVDARASNGCIIGNSAKPGNQLVNYNNSNSASLGQNIIMVWVVYLPNT